jgi:hypothetical protein
MTTTYINEVSENIYQFKLGRFLSMQGTIYDKFKLDESGIDLIDKYLFQILEEIHEVNNESHPTDKAMEMIDVMMYIGSAFYTVESFHAVSSRVIVKNKHSVDIKACMDEVFNSIIIARRMYPERKWHKDYDESKLIADRGQVFGEIFINCIMTIMNALITNHHYLEVDSMIENKQKFINEL